MKFTNKKMAKYSRGILISNIDREDVKVQPLSVSAISRINERAKISIDSNRKQQVSDIINAENIIVR